MTHGGIVTSGYLEYRPHLAEAPEGEDALIEKMVQDLEKNNLHQYTRSVNDPKLWRHDKPHAIRDAHAKSHGILYGELTVLPDLDPALRQGMFAEPGRTYEVIARISSTSGAIRSDQVRGVRGLGLKVLGVEGERVDKERFPENQDFVFVTEPAFLFKDAEDYAHGGMRTAKALSHTPDWGMMTLNRLLRAVRRAVESVGGTLPPKLRVFADPNRHVLGQPFYTAAPIRYGQFVAKLSVTPKSDSVRALANTTIDPHGSQALTDAVTGFFASNSAEYTVSVQLCTNTTDMPIEDATKEWPEDLSPYRPVATIVYPQQTAYSDALRDFGDDVLTINSWRAIEEHIPLGSINRLKLRVYEASSDFRHKLNCVERFEPTDLTSMPG
ncbi:catalase family protein [Mycobacterium sp. Y57]|uniref:catalase family protein n=1 Tax=Mycolicibacterium xanthum TaxID=2796469 RepID=UPI001C860C7A|nr:catalase family protein [Mycolicibacterium xanthum]MBX7431370.1 catalase family protein [Mycolicibacterium xanthum]